MNRIKRICLFIKNAFNEGRRQPSQQLFWK